MRNNRENKQVKETEFGAISERLMKSRRKLTEIQVDIIPSDIFKDAAKYVIVSANRIFRDSVNAPIVECELLERYFYDALVHRVATCNPEMKGNYTLKARAINYPLPAIVYNAIRQVGQATDKAFGIRFTPSITFSELKLHTSKPYDVKATEANRYSEYTPISEEEFDMVLNMFMALEEEGYVITGALSREIYGDINFMALTNVESMAEGATNGPRGYRDTNPVYAFYRSFFYNQQLSQLCDTIYTYQYNDMDEMAMVLRDLAFSKTQISGLSEVLSEFK